MPIGNETLGEGVLRRMDVSDLMRGVGAVAGMLLLALVLGALSVGAFKLFTALTGWGRPKTDEAFDAEHEGETCTRCGYDLRSSRDRCPECGADMAEMRAERAQSSLDPHRLRDDWPTSDVAIRRPAPEEVPVQVHETINPFEADLLVAQLQARGVQAGVSIAETASLAGRDRRTYKLVMVSSGDEEIARAIIDRFRWKQQPETPNAAASE